MPETQWQRRFDEPEKDTEEIANMDRTDYEVLLAAAPASLADGLQDALNGPVPFGVAHAADGSRLPVYKSASTRNQVDTLADRQLCAILSSSVSGRKTWLKIRYAVRNQLREGYIPEDGFHQLTVAGLAGAMADAATASSVNKLIQGVSASQFVAQATATPAPTARRRATATPAPAGRKRYVLNTQTMKFHLPSCADADKIANENKKTTTTTRENLISQGYTPCLKCDP